MKKFKTVGLVTAALVLCAAIAFASDGEGGGHNKLLDLLYRFINFGIVAFLVYKFAGKRIADMLSGRSKQIETDLADLDERKEDAEKRLLEVEVAARRQPADAVFDERQCLRVLGEPDAEDLGDPAHPREAGRRVAGRLPPGDL